MATEPPISTPWCVGIVAAIARALPLLTLPHLMLPFLTLPFLMLPFLMPLFVALPSLMLPVA